VTPPVTDNELKANFYCELNFSWGTVPAEGIVSIEIAIFNATNYSGHIFDESDDWSYADNLDFALHDKMLIVDASSGEELFGIPPFNIVGSNFGKQGTVVIN
jgi:hypothetical protein